MRKPSALSTSLILSVYHEQLPPQCTTAAAPLHPLRDFHQANHLPPPPSRVLL